jgi:pantetheine-phosphate adenylyltransferase
MERVGLYPGTFDPVTMGHIDIIGRAMKLVDRLIIGVAVSEAKRPLFVLEERIKMMQEECGALEGPGRAKIEVKPFDKLLMHFAEELDVRMSLSAACAPFQTLNTSFK